MTSIHTQITQDLISWPPCSSVSATVITYFWAVIQMDLNTEIIFLKFSKQILMKEQARHSLYSAKSCQRWRKYTFLNAPARQHLYKEAYNIKPGVKGSWNLQHLALWWKMFWASGIFNVKMWDGRISGTSSSFLLWWKVQWSAYATNMLAF